MSETHKTVILDNLYRWGAARGVGDLRTRLISSSNHPMDFDGLVKVIWAMQKDGSVTFRERGNDLRHIELTMTGRGRILEAKTGQAQVLEDGDELPKTVGPQRIHAVGTDMTEPSNHGSKAQGGPVMVINKRPAKPKVIKAPEYVPERATVLPVGDPPRQNELNPSPMTDLTHGEGTEVHGKYMGSTWEAGWTWEQTLEWFVHNYPLVAEIFARVAKREGYEAAAKALEGVDDDMALKLLDKVKFTPLEQEVIRLVRAVR